MSSWVEKLVTSPKNANVVVWSPDYKSVQATSFRCLYELATSNLPLGLMIIAMPKMESEFPNCLNCLEFIKPMQDKGIIHKDQIVEVYSKDVITQLPKIPAGCFSNN